MNLLLLEPGELDAHGRVTLRDRRALHLRTVLRTEVGRTVRAGIVDGPLATAEVLAIDGDAVTIGVVATTAAPCAPDVLLLAMPRPQVLLRIYAHAAALGFGQLVLFRSWRVDKAHLGSDALSAAVQQHHLRLGLEQAGRTRVPKVSLFPLFRPFVEDHLPRLELPAERFVAHPDAPIATAELALAANTPFALALGPEGGLLPYEVDRLRASGFVPVSCGPHALRTETALAVLAGQLDLLRRRVSVRS